MPGLAGMLNMPFNMPKPGGAGGSGMMVPSINMPGILPTNITNLPMPNMGQKSGGEGSNQQQQGQGQGMPFGFPGLQPGGIAGGMQGMFDPSKMPGFPMGFPGMPGMPGQNQQKGPEGQGQ